METNTSTSTAPPAPVPFDSPHHGADLVMITSDGAILYVVKAFLVYASPFFANLLGDSSPNETHENLPVYRSSEDCHTMCAVLRLCYPASIEPKTIAEVSVGDALQKYMMEDAQERMKDLIRSSGMMKTEPIRIFAIACRCRWGDVARTAARAILSIPPRDWQTSKALRNITGMDYHVLVQYYMQCCDAVEQAFSSGGAVGPAVPLRSSDDATRLRSMVDNSGRTFSLFVRCQDGSCNPSWASVPSWVRRIIENARDRSRTCPGRAITCDESLVVVVLDSGQDSRNLQSSTVLEVCKIIDAGVQAVINKVEIQLDFK